MPQFQKVPIHEAKMKTATGRAAKYMREYVDYIQQLGSGEAGVLMVADGETVPTVRRRLTTAAELLGKELVVKRTGDQIYFWVEPSMEPAEEARPRRRGRRRAQAEGESALHE